MEEELNIEYVLKATINLLGEINIPMSMFDQIGKPIKSAIDNLTIGLVICKQDDSKEVNKNGNADTE